MKRAISIGSASSPPCPYDKRTGLICCLLLALGCSGCVEEAILGSQIGDLAWSVGSPFLLRPNTPKAVLEKIETAHKDFLVVVQSPQATEKDKRLALQAYLTTIKIYSQSASGGFGPSAWEEVLKQLGSEEGKKQIQLLAKYLPEPFNELVPSLLGLGTAIGLGLVARSRGQWHRSTLGLGKAIESLKPLLPDKGEGDTVRRVVGAHLGTLNPLVHNALKKHNIS